MTRGGHEQCRPSPTRGVTGQVSRGLSGILPYKGVFPTLGRDVFIAPGAWVIGDVEIGDGTSIWFNTVVRGDVNFIRIGCETNIQDNVTLHVTGKKFPLFIGNRVTVGHQAVVHGCIVEDECLIGMGAVVLDGARIGTGSIVAAGAVVRPGTQVPPGSVVMGIPAEVKKTLTEEEKERIRETAVHYMKLARRYMEEENRSGERPIQGFLG